MSLDDYIRRFQSLPVNRAHGHESPHKAVMLLTVIQLFQEGKIYENAIRFDSHLLETYRAFFEVVATDRDRPNPYFPFFHLKGGNNTRRFWHPVAKPGRAEFLAGLRSARGIRDVEENIDHIRLSEELFDLMRDPESRAVLRGALVARWFPDHKESLLAVAEKEKEIADYIGLLKEVAEGTGYYSQRAPAVSDDTRDSAFARTVRGAYDSRCAATGWRIVLPDGGAMVQAAHLIPWSISQDDDPRNGIALTPTFHWALDRHLMAPGPDFMWHVSNVFDRRNRDYSELLEFDGKEIILPSEEKYLPRKDALEWRMKRLLRRNWR